MKIKLSYEFNAFIVHDKNYWASYMLTIIHPTVNIWIFM